MEILEATRTFLKAVAHKHELTEKQDLLQLINHGINELNAFPASAAIQLANDIYRKSDSQQPITTVTTDNKQRGVNIK